MNGALAPALALAPAVALAACGDDGAAHADNSADGAGPCEVRIEHHPAQGGMHVNPGTPVTWSSNPPSSGPHYYTWARWAKAYTLPVPRGNYVHNEEHGGVILLYHCPTECQDLVAQLEAIGAALPQDPSCSGFNARWILTPDDALDPGVVVAAAAWEWTWEAACLDEASLLAFLGDHYARAPEDTCADGVDLQP